MICLLCLQLALANIMSEKDSTLLISAAEGFLLEKPITIVAFPATRNLSQIRRVLKQLANLNASSNR